MGIVEEAEGVRNIRDILRQVKGIGAIWASPGDLSLSLGKRGNAADPEVQEELLHVLEACKEYGVPCATGAAPADVAQRIEQGFRIIMAGPARTPPTLDAGRRIVER
jgi:4-hydroxy-2-oxoheptanedioate aldolase